MDPDTGSGKSLARNAPARERLNFSGSGPLIEKRCLALFYYITKSKYKFYCLLTKNPCATSSLNYIIIKKFKI